MLAVRVIHVNGISKKNLRCSAFKPPIILCESVLFAPKLDENSQASPPARIFARPILASLLTPEILGAKSLLLLFTKSHEFTLHGFSILASLATTRLEFFLESSAFELSSLWFSQIWKYFFNFFNIHEIAIHVFMNHMPQKSLIRNGLLCGNSLKVPEIR